MNTYTAVTGQTLYDICLITYGSLDYMTRLANDNGITDLNNNSLTGIAFVYDNALIVNQVLHQKINQQYGTATTVYGTGGYHDDYFDDTHD